MPNSDELKGRAKQAAGDLTDDQELKDEGRADETSGKAKQAIDKVEDKAKGAVDKIKGAVKR